MSNHSFLSLLGDLCFLLTHPTNTVGQGFWLTYYLSSTFYTFYLITRLKARPGRFTLFSPVFLRTYFSLLARQRIFEHVFLAFRTITHIVINPICGRFSCKTEEDDLLSRSTKKLKRRSSGDLVGCYVPGYRHRTSGRDPKMQSQLVGVTYLERIPLFVRRTLRSLG